MNANNLNSFIRISILLCVFMSGCNEKRAFRGDGNLVHLPKPGILGVDGYALRFSAFPVSSDFSVSYSFTNLPVRTDPYRLYLIPDDDVPTAALKSATISVSLTESGGAVQLEITNAVSNWVASSYYISPSKLHREFRLATSRSDLDSASFNPKPHSQYELKISYRSPEGLQTSQASARFELRRAAGK